MTATAYPAWLVDAHTRRIRGTDTTATRRADGVFEITVMRACEAYGVAIMVDGEKFLGIMSTGFTTPALGDVIEVRMPRRQI